MILQVFNKYREPGGEEMVVSWITENLGNVCEIENLCWLTESWDGPSRPQPHGAAQAILLQS